MFENHSYKEKIELWISIFDMHKNLYGYLLKMYILGLIFNLTEFVYWR